MPNTLEDLRSHLFETLKALREKEKPMDIDRAKAISEVAKTVIDSAKVEVDYLRAVGSPEVELPVFGKLEAKKPALPAGVNGVKTHKLS